MIKESQDTGVSRNGGPTDLRTQVSDFRKAEAARTTKGKHQRGERVFLPQKWV